MPHIEVIARAVVVVDDHILLCRVEGEEHDFLPGGHVEIGESAHESLRREMIEELGEVGTATRVGSYLGAVEHMYRSEGVKRHEVNHCFEVEIPGLSVDDTPESPESYLFFRWEPLAMLRAIDLRPAPMLDLVLDADDEEDGYGPRWFSTIAAGGEQRP